MAEQKTKKEFDHFSITSVEWGKSMAKDWKSEVGTKTRGGELGKRTGDTLNTSISHTWRGSSKRARREVGKRKSA